MLFGAMLFVAMQFGAMLLGAMQFGAMPFGAMLLRCQDQRHATGCLALKGSDVSQARAA